MNNETPSSTDYLHGKIDATNEHLAHIILMIDDAQRGWEQKKTDAKRSTNIHNQRMCNARLDTLDKLETRVLSYWRSKTGEDPNNPHLIYCIVCKRRNVPDARVVHKCDRCLELATTATQKPFRNLHISEVFQYTKGFGEYQVLQKQSDLPTGTALIQNIATQELAVISSVNNSYTWNRPVYIL